MLQPLVLCLLEAGQDVAVSEERADVVYSIGWDEVVWDEMGWDGMGWCGMVLCGVV